MNSFLINTSVPVTQYSKMLTFRDTIKSCKIDGDLLKTKTNYKFNDDQSKLRDRKISQAFGKELKFDLKQKGRKRHREKSMIKLLNSIAIMASGFSTVFLPSDPEEMCDRKKILLREKQAGNNSDIINEETVAIVDRIIEYKCIPMKQHEQSLINCNLMHTKKK